MYRHYIAIVALLFSGSFVVLAQKKWDLKQCIEYAIEHNIEIKKRILEKENREITLQTSQMSRLPDLNASMGQDFYFGRGPSRDGTYQDKSQASSSFRVGTNIPVFTGFRIPNEIEARKLDLKSAVENLNKAREDIALSVTSYYLQTLFNKELVGISMEQVALSRSQMEKTDLLVKNGKSPESALYESKAMLAKDELSLTQAQNNLSLSLLDLSQLLNLTDNADFDVITPNLPEVVEDGLSGLVMPTDVFQNSVSKRPIVKSAEYALESSRRSLKVAQAGYFPKISFGAYYSNSYYHTYNANNLAFGDQLRNNGSESLGLSLSIPIFNRFATRNQVRSARVNIANQQLLLENAKLILYKEIEQAYYSAIAAHKKMISSLKSVEAARIAFAYEEQKFAAGKSTTFEYNDAKTRLEKSRSEHVQAQFDFIFRSKVLDFYNGKPLVFDMN